MRTTLHRNGNLLACILIAGWFVANPALAQERREREEHHEHEREHTEREHDEDDERHWEERREREHMEREREEHQRRPSVEGMVHRELAEVEPDQRRALMHFIHEHFRPQLRELEELVRRAPDEAWEFIEHLCDEARELWGLRHEQPELFEKRMHLERLERDAHELAEHRERAEDAKREKIDAELREILDKAFELKQEMLKAETAELEEELARLKRLVEKRETNRKSIIERHLQELQGEEDYLEW